MSENHLLILADPKGGAWDFTEKVFKKIVKLEKHEPKKERRVYTLGEIILEKFNDGEIKPRIKTNVRKHTCFVIHDSTMYPSDWFFTLDAINDALMRSSANKINNVLPYMKFSRQDRMTESRTPISTSLVADIINKNANRVLTTDLHNPASTNAYRVPFDNLRAHTTMINYLKKNHSEFLDNAILVAPDAGSGARVDSYNKRLQLNAAFAHKKREKAGIIKNMTIIGDVKNKNCIIIDDMIDSGGTLIKAAETLKNYGAKKIYAVATHGLFSKGISKLINSPLEKIIITDTIPQENRDKIEVVTLTDLFAQAIYRIGHGYSISELYE